jgi:hypothetical protein
VKGVCSSCKRQKYEVHGYDSVLVPGMKLLMCKTCMNKGFEPRHLIILAARSGGLKAASPYIVNNRYIGDKILAQDILKSN